MWHRRGSVFPKKCSWIHNEEFAYQRILMPTSSQLKVETGRNKQASSGQNNGALQIVWSVQCQADCTVSKINKMQSHQFSLCISKACTAHYILLVQHRLLEYETQNFTNSQLCSTEPGKRTKTALAFYTLRWKATLMVTLLQATPQVPRTFSQYWTSKHTPTLLALQKRLPTV